MGMNEEEALAEVIKATAYLLGVPVSRHAIAIITLPNVMYDIIVYRYPGKRGWRKRVELERAHCHANDAFISHKQNLHEAIAVIANFQAKYEIPSEFVYRRLDDPAIYANPNWTLVHSYSLFARYVCGAGVPVRREYVSN